MPNTWFPTIAELEAYDRVRHRFLGARRLHPSEVEGNAAAVVDMISQIFATVSVQEPSAPDPRSVIVELD